MGNKNIKLSLEDMQDELDRVKYKERYIKVLFNTIFILITVSAIAILLSTLFFPVLQIYGSSMTPTYQDDDLVVCIKTNDFELGDTVAFYYNNKLLVKRIIASEGEWVNIDQEGNVYINDEMIIEDYIMNKSIGECDIELPYQVPSGTYFVMGDHRDTSMDSRLEEIGCVEVENVVGKILGRVWPIPKKES